MKRQRSEKTKQMKRATSKKESHKESASAKKSSKEKEPKEAKETKSKTKTPPPLQAVSAPVTLGSKRGCQKCHTKFYDFGRNPILCPKCGAEVDPEAAMPVLPRAPEPKKKSADKAAEAILSGDDGGVELDAFESADDLGDDDAVEDISVDDDDSDDEF